MAEVEGLGDNGMNNNNMEVLLTIHDMASSIRETNQHNHEPHEETKSDQIMRIQGEFRKTRPSIFKGDLNPMQAEEWVPKNLKVTITCTYLEGQAYHLWESVLVIFLEKYLPETIRAMKTREFANLC
ncbi:hypothetical protein D8674_011544 [Pyrus ussuriensis x Pyrus communis]|uniref:Uncharacterized protein n=1 Tax=Pyrus ussuriensis x Pyrus communis TaxID=2448454 RepID=A0A5N5FZ54_9ROSA|nr:hypothetical protein D8674_011544 [Pyrus ussuriensis x Pyrus communis]